MQALGAESDWALPAPWLDVSMARGGVGVWTVGSSRALLSHPVVTGDGGLMGPIMLARREASGGACTSPASTVPREERGRCARGPNLGQEN